MNGRAAAARSGEWAQHFSNDSCLSSYKTAVECFICSVYVIVERKLAMCHTVQKFHEHASRCKRYLEQSSVQPISVEFRRDLHRLQSRARHHK